MVKEQETKYDNMVRERKKKAGREYQSTVSTQKYIEGERENDTVKDSDKRQGRKGGGRGEGEKRMEEDIRLQGSSLGNDPTFLTALALPP